MAISTKFFSEKRYDMMKEGRSDQKISNAIDYKFKNSNEKYITVSDLKNARKRKKISIGKLLILAEFFDCHPYYLSGELNDKAEDNSLTRDLHQLSKEEYLSKFPFCTEAQYESMLYQYPVDDEGFITYRYSTYLYELEEPLRLDSIKVTRDWLYSIFNSEIMLLFPEIPHKLIRNDDEVISLLNLPKEEAMNDYLRKLDDSSIKQIQFFLIKGLREYLVKSGIIESAAINESEV